MHEQRSVIPFIDMHRHTYAFHSLLRPVHVATQAHVIARTDVPGMQAAVLLPEVLPKYAFYLQTIAIIDTVADNRISPDDPAPEIEQLFIHAIKRRHCRMANIHGGVFFSAWSSDQSL